jgi:hypothetical protein
MLSLSIVSLNAKKSLTKYFQNGGDVGVCVTSLNSQKNTPFKNIKFDPPCHLKKSS